jgi:hypothetical protein
MHSSVFVLFRLPHIFLHLLHPKQRVFLLPVDVAAAHMLPYLLLLCVLSLCCAGSRSSPLALAAASHPRSQLTIAIDERSLGFWALGFSRANPSGLPAAVICSSGTAVANLLPAVVEASQSNVPLLLLTADRWVHQCCVLLGALLYIVFETPAPALLALDNMAVSSEDS